jgi:nanoRNase/pAp phosphatase (c-di-AMP/oligoRNAs hydrolase)
MFMPYKWSSHAQDFINISLSENEQLKNLLLYIRGGEFIVKYIESTQRRFTFKLRHVIDGVRFVVYNTHIRTSQIHKINPDEEDGIMVWNNDLPGKVRVSLYTDKLGLDLSSIARKFGGGGHRQACGFTMELQQFINIFITNGPETTNV